MAPARAIVMMNKDLTNWLLGAMFAIMLALVGIVYQAMDSRADRIEAKVDAIQAQYGRIAVVEQAVTEQGKQLDRIEQRMYQGFRELK